VDLTAKDSIAVIKIVGWSKELNIMRLTYSSEQGFEKQKWIPIANKEMCLVNGELRPRFYYELPI
jgi:hypothetical protein